MTGPTIAVLGGSLSGNKGAASMALAVVDGTPAMPGAPDVAIFTAYPDADRRLAPDLDVVAFQPSGMVLRVLPAAFLSLVTARRWHPRRGPAARLAAAEVVADVSGISFMAGRGALTLGYNVLLVGLPWAFGVPVVKVAQAMGPFGRGVTRLVARVTLARCRWIGARGAATLAHVESLGVRQVEQAADVAFLLTTDAASEAWAQAQIAERDRVVLVMPSEVVARTCAAAGVDYPGLMAGLLADLVARGHDVRLVAHSAREGAAAGRTNDLPLCRRLAAAAHGVHLVDGEQDARRLRALVSRARLVLTSRFHGMVSALATGTPTVVLGWSHKYTEVLADFGQDDAFLDFRSATQEELLATVLRADATRATIRATLADRLPAVQDLARRNLTRLSDLATSTEKERTRDQS
ncbi:MAG: polysaccharide pyruvyl transferase family protein [Actinomycetes bacterium]